VCHRVFVKGQMEGGSAGILLSTFWCQNYEHLITRYDLRRFFQDPPSVHKALDAVTVQTSSIYALDDNYVNCMQL